MRRVGSIDELLGSDEPACFVDRSFLCWGTPRGVGGHCVWGRPDGRDAEAFVAALGAIVRRPNRHPRAIVADFRALSSVEPDAFTAVREHLRRDRERIAALGIREALLYPDGIVGSVVAGFYSIAPKPIESRAFRDVERAFAWLGMPEARATFAEVERLQAELAAGAPISSRLRALLDETPDEVTLARAARALGLSARSLQRELALAGTSFRQLQDAARLARAEALLRGDDKLAAIAIELGFSQPQHFASWFKRQTGRSPSAWRRDPS